MAMTPLDVGKEQIKFTRSILHILSLTSLLSGLLIWSIFPFTFQGKSASKITMRYIGIVAPLGLGILSLACGIKLIKNQHLYKAIEIAEADSFRHWVAVNQGYSEQSYEALAENTSENFPGELTGNLPASGISEPEMAEVPISGDFPDSTSGSGNVNLDISPEILREISAGKSDSWIIQNILNCRGRNYAKGKEELEKIKRILIQEQED